MSTATNCEKRKRYKNNTFVYSKELCLEILKRRENSEFFTKIYNDLDLKKYYPYVSSAIKRFYHDSKGYGIDISKAVGRKDLIYTDITPEKYNKMYKDLKNNPKKYTIVDFFAKYGITDKNVISWLTYTSIKIQPSIVSIRKNFIIDESKSCKTTGWYKYRKIRVEKSNKQHTEIAMLLEKGYKFEDIYKKFGYASLDNCATSHRHWVKQQNKKK